MSESVLEPPAVVSGGSTRRNADKSRTESGPAIGDEQGAGQIAYASNADGDFDIYLVDLKSGDSTKLTDNRVDDFGPSSPSDGEHIVYVTGSLVLQGNSDLSIMRWDGSDRRTLISTPQHEERIQADLLRERSPS